MIVTEKIIGELTDVLKEIDAKVPEIRKHLEENKKSIDSFSRGKNVPGIYAFFIKPKNGVNLYSFEDLWLDKDIRNYPQVVHSRFQAATQEKKEIYTLYLGKS